MAASARPTSTSLWAALAEYAYKAHNVRVGDLASEKAVSLAPAAQRAQLKNQLAALRKNPSGTETQTATSKSGQPFVVKRSPNGSLTATPATTGASGTATTPGKK